MRHIIHLKHRHTRVNFSGFIHVAHWLTLLTELKIILYFHHTCCLKVEWQQFYLSSLTAQPWVNKFAFSVLTLHFKATHDWTEEESQQHQQQHIQNKMWRSCVCPSIKKEKRENFFDDDMKWKKNEELVWLERRWNHRHRCMDGISGATEMKKKKRREERKVEQRKRLSDSGQKKRESKPFNYVLPAPTRPNSRI